MGTKGTKGTTVGGSPTGPMKQILPTEKSKSDTNMMPKVKSIAAGSNMDHDGGTPKGKIR